MLAVAAAPPPVAATGLLAVFFVARRLVVAAFAPVLGPFSATFLVLFALVAFPL